MPMRSSPETSGLPGSPWVYPDKTGANHVNQYSTCRRVFETAVSKARLGDMVWHDLRHTFASRLVMSGVDLLTVSRLMGHKTTAMTQRYAHLAPDHLHAAVKSMAQKFSRR